MTNEQLAALDIAALVELRKKIDETLIAKRKALTDQLAQLKGAVRQPRKPKASAT